MASPDWRLSISSFGSLLKITEIIWSNFSLLISRGYKAIILWQASFGSWKISILCSSLLFSRSKFLLCHPSSSTSFSKILNLLSFTISHIINIFFNFCWLMFNDFSHFNSSKLLIWFISLCVAFSARPYICRLSSSIFFCKWAVSLFCDLILLSS